MGSGRVPHWVRVTAAVLGLLMALLTWAFASPVGSAPDDDFHVANIYCIHDSSTCRSDDWMWPGDPPWWHPDPADRKGPEYAGAKAVYADIWRYPYPRALPCYVTNGAPWYSPDASVPATCLNAEDATNNQPATLDVLGYYPSAFYQFMSVFTQSTIRQSVVLWRVINVLIAVLALSGSVLLSARRYRRPIGVGSLVASMPLGLFLVSSVNPSSWLIIGTAAFLGPAITLLRERGSPPLIVGRIAFLLVCLLMIVAGRSEGVGHAAVLVGIALLIGLKAPRYVYWLVGTAAGVVVLLAIILLRGSGASKTQATLDWLHSGLSSGTLWHTLMSVPGFFFGADATRLGWLDVIPPPAAVSAVGAAFWGAAILGLTAMFWRKALTVVVVSGVLIAVPAVMIAGGSQILPTRYFLPLVYMFAFVILVPDWGKWLPRWSRAQWVALWAALSFANSLSLLYLTVRYVSGIQPGTTSPRALAATPTPDWWWGAWLSPFGNWALGSVAFAAAVGLLFTLPSIREGAEDHPQADERERPDSPNLARTTRSEASREPLSAARGSRSEAVTSDDW